MSIRILAAAFALLVLISGCHSTSRYGASYAPPCPTPCPTPCSTCGTPAPPGTVAAVAGY